MIVDCRSRSRLSWCRGSLPEGTAHGHTEDYIRQQNILTREATTSQANSAEYSRGAHTRSNGKVHEEGAPKHLKHRQPSSPSFPPFSPSLPSQASPISPQTRGPIELRELATYTGDGLDGHFRRSCRRLELGSRCWGASLLSCCSYSRFCFRVRNLGRAGYCGLISPAQSRGSPLDPAAHVTFIKPWLYVSSGFLTGGRNRDQWGKG